MKEFLKKYLFGKTQKMLQEKEISLEKLNIRLKDFELELKVKSESLLLKQIYLIEQNKNIEKRLEDGSKRFDKLENMIWAVYPFILLSVVLSKFI